MSGNDTRLLESSKTRFAYWGENAIMNHSWRGCPSTENDFRNWLRPKDFSRGTTTKKILCSRAAFTTLPSASDTGNSGSPSTAGFSPGNVPLVDTAKPLRPGPQIPNKNPRHNGLRLGIAAVGRLIGVPVVIGFHALYA